MKPRYYQTEAIQAIFDYFKVHSGNPLLQLPTGSGKGIIIGLFVKMVLQKWSGQRIMMLTHVKELIEQNHKKLTSIWPEAPCGIHSASIGEYALEDKVIFAGIQSIYTKAMQVGHIDLILIDECHLVPKKGMGMYNRFISEMLAINPKLKIIGLSATPFRLDSGSLLSGKGALFTDLVYQVSIKKMIDEGYLCKVVTPSVSQVDTSGLGHLAGEYINSQQEKLFDTDEITTKALQEALIHAGDRKKWLIFCVSEKHATHVSEALDKLHISNRVIMGNTPKKKRTEYLELYAQGEIRALINVNVLTTGVDIPDIDCLILLRKTKSLALYIQIIGRGMRMFTGKLNCLVLDFAGNIEEHGPIDQARPKEKFESKNKEKKTMPVKSCPLCQAPVQISSRECPDCGYLFPPPDIKHDTKASNGIIVSESIHVTLKVDHVRYSLHRKEVSSLRVDYVCGMKTISEWIPFEQKGGLRDKALKWWYDCAKAYTPPTDATDALTRARNNEIFEPKAVTVDFSEKYPEIVKRTFSQDSLQ